MAQPLHLPLPLLFVAAFIVLSTCALTTSTTSVPAIDMAGRTTLAGDITTGPTARSASLASPSKSVHSDEIAVTGTVYYWTLEDINGLEFCDASDDFKSFQGGKYLPLKNTYIESEYTRIGNDPDSYTAENGYYYLKNSGLDEGSYDVDLEIRAKTIMNSRWTLLGTRDTVVSIFKSSLDAYAVNAQTDSHSVHTGDSLTLDIYIGGPKNNLIGNNNEGLDALISYWLAQDLANYYHEVTHLAPDPADFPNDSYLESPRSASLYHSIHLPTKGHIELDDYDKLFPSQIIAQGGSCDTNNISQNWKLLQATARHEYSHQIMDMVYPQMPADDTGSHSPNTCSNPETAWVEGFAEFLPAAIMNWQTMEGVQGRENLEFNYNPYMGPAPTRTIYDEPFNPLQPPEKGLGSIMWHYLIGESCNSPETSEGEVAAVLWDIFDGKGWEYLPEQYQPAAQAAGIAVSPPAQWKRPLRWFDHLADGYLGDFWGIFKQSPANLVGDHSGNNGSFWALWLNKYKNDPSRTHGLKAVLYNRGIDPAPKAEHAPKIDEMSIDGTNSRINLTISEQDPEDRGFLYFNVGYLKQLDGSEFSYYYTEDRPVSDLGGNWQDGKIHVSIEIPRGKLGRVNGVLVHDSMLVDYRSAAINTQDTQLDLLCAGRQPNNFTTAVAIQGNYAYVTDMESGLYVYELSKPGELHELALLRSNMNTDKPWGGAMDVAVAGSHAYIAAYSGALVVVDVSQPANPRLTGYVPIQGDPRAVAVSGNKAYVVKGTGGLTIFNIQSPDSPVEYQTLGTGGAFDVAIVGNRAYVAADGGVQIFSLGLFPNHYGDISIPGDSVSGVTLSENGLVYLATRNGTLQVFDLSTWQPVYANLLAFLNQPVDPEIAFPVKIDELTASGLPGRITLSGKSLYGAGGIYDVSNPELIYRLAPLTGDEIALKGDAIYAAAGNQGFLAYSRTLPPGAESNCGSGGVQNGYLQEAGAWQGHINDMVFANQHGFLAAGEEGLKIVSVADPQAIKQVATYYEEFKHPYELNAMGVEVDATGSLVFLPSMAGDLHILDISQPASPKPLGLVEWNRYANVGAWQDISSQYGFAFVCAGLGGMRVLDVRTPANPPWKGKFTNAITDCNDITAALPLVYGLSFSSGLHVFEMIGPMLHTTPEFRERTGWSLSEGISGTNYSSLYLDESRKLLYVSALWNGVTILDVSDPSQPPTALGSIDPGGAYGMAGYGNLLYVGDNGIVHIIDVSDARNPKLVAEQVLSERYGEEITAKVLKVYDGYLYVATDRDSLQAYRILK